MRGRGKGRGSVHVADGVRIRFRIRVWARVWVRAGGSHLVVPVRGDVHVAVRAASDPHRPSDHALGVGALECARATWLGLGLGLGLGSG